LTTYDIDETEFLKKKEEIIAGYAAKRESSCEIGTAIHLEKELQFYNESTRDLQKFGLGGKFYCEKGYYQLDQDRAVYPEFLISYKFPNGLKVSGQIDLLIKDGYDIFILDYKTNDKIEKQSYFDRKTKSYQMMKYPLNNIMDTNY
jgi:ATP-dependent exoDNAse (exonuclease V) beta subunit